MRLRAWVAAALMIAAATACASQQPHLHGTMPPAGHEAPENAVAGFYRGLLGGNALVTCSYVDPGEGRATSASTASA
jgi:hypothetical protein